MKSVGHNGDSSIAHPLGLQLLILIADEGDGGVLTQNVNLTAHVHFQEPAGGITLVHPQCGTAIHVEQFCLAVFSSSFNKHIVSPLSCY